MSTVLHAVVDYENNSEAFWEAFHRAFPQSESTEFFTFSEQEWQQVQQLPGWDDPQAPRHAPHPLILVEEGDNPIRKHK